MDSGPGKGLGISLPWMLRVSVYGGARIKRCEFWGTMSDRLVGVLFS